MMSRTSNTTTMERSRSTASYRSDDEQDDQQHYAPQQPKAVKPARRRSLGQSLAKNLDKLLERSRSTVACSDDEQDDHHHQRQQQQQHDVAPPPNTKVKLARRPSLTQSLAKNLDKLSCITPSRKKKSGFRKGVDDSDDDEGSIDLNCNSNNNSDAMPFVGGKSPYTSSKKTEIGSLFAPGSTAPFFSRGHASTPNLTVHIGLDDGSSPKSGLGDENDNDECVTPSQQRRQKMNLLEMFSNSCSRFMHYSDDMSSDGAFSLEDGSTTESPRSNKGSASHYSKAGGVLATPVQTLRRRMRRQNSSDLPGAPSLSAAGGGDPSIDGGYESTCSGCSVTSSGSRGTTGTPRVRRVKRSKSKVKATALLGGIQQEIEIQTRALQEHDRFINIQVKIAKTRLSMGNEMSAVLAYKKVKQVQAERARVVKAIEVLERHLAGVQGQLDKAKAIAEAQLIEGNNNKNNSSTTSRTKVVIDFQAHKNYAQEVALVLSGEGSEQPGDGDELPMSRKNLLAEMEAFPL